MPNLVYSTADFQPFTVIRSSEVNAKFNDIKTLLNTTKLDDTNIQDAGITRATKLKTGTADHVIINNGSGAMSSEAQLATTRGGTGINPTLTNNAGKALAVNDAETGFELRTPSVDVLIESLATHVNTLTAGEGLSARDAVCLDLNQGAYKVFKCDANSSQVRKSNYIGFARSTVTATPQISTYTIDAAFVTSNVVQTTVNGTVYYTPFNSSSDETLQDVATAIATHPDVQSAIVTVIGGNQTGSDDRVITVTGKGALTLNISGVVTGGASQPNIAVVNTQNPAGGNAQIHAFGPLGGFTGLTLGDIYYLSTTPGAITNAPTDASPLRVGQALSTTVLFVSRFQDGYAFPSSTLFVRSNGSTSTNTFTDATNATEHFNFGSWTSGTASPSARAYGQYGESNFNNKYYWIDGFTTAGVPATATTQVYNKSSWTTEATRSSARGEGGIGVLSGTLVAAKGSSQLGPATAVADLDVYNGVSWSNAAATFANDGFMVGCFFQGSTLSFLAGFQSSSAYANVHQTWNGSSTGSATVYPLSDSVEASARIGSSGFGAGASSSGTGSYVWNGASWSGSITVPYVINAQGGGVQGGGAACGYNSSNSKAYINGGNPSGTTATNSTANLDGSSWISDAASTNSVTGSGGSVI